MAAMAASDGGDGGAFRGSAQGGYADALSGGSSKGIYCPQADRDHMWRCVHPPQYQNTL